MSRYEMLWFGPHQHIRFRRLMMEHLERRMCLWATSFGTLQEGWGPNGEYLAYLTFTGDASVDTLSNIHRGEDGKIWYETSTAPGVPQPTYAWAPSIGVSFINISIFGEGHNDVVDLTGSFADWDDTINLLLFDGGNGWDEFKSTDEAFLPPNGAPRIEFYGRDGNDEFVGHGLSELFDGGPGIDVGDGSGGDDILEGGDGQDTLSGGNDNDTITGGGWNDFLYGGDGTDAIYGGDEDDTINGNDGEDVIFGNSGADTIDGGNHNDIIYAGPGRDTVNGNEGNDSIVGEGIEGEVLLFGDVGDDSIAGSEGPDTIDGYHGWDTILGNGGADAINGGFGNDTLSGGGGVDTIHGDGDADTILGGADGDILYGDEGGDTIYGQGGPDSIDGGAGNDTTYSNTAGEIDQPYLGDGPNPGWPDMRHTGGDDCDLEDGHADLDPGCPPPVAFNDAYGCSSHAGSPPLQVNAPGVLSNDQHADAVELVPDTGPSHGSLSLSSNGALTYTPTLNYYGSDSFQYRAVDSASGKKSAPATVTIAVYSYYQPLTLNMPPVQEEGPACGCGRQSAARPAPSSVTQDDLLAFSQFALARWEDAGVSEAVTTALAAGLVLEVADLPGSVLGLHQPDGRILIDINAAGYGWFIDATPLDDREFARRVSRSQREATTDSDAYGKADLLTVVMHEIGHSLGLDHDHSDGDSTNLMNGTIGLGTRRVPTAHDAAVVDYLFALTQSERRRR